MSADWRQLSRGAGFRVEGDAVVVPLGGGRTQRVEIDAHREDAGVWLASHVAPPRIVRRIPDILERIGRQNRLSELVAYRLDSRGRLVGECWVPAAGLTADEWAFYVRTLAAACDRLELVLTGRIRGEDAWIPFAFDYRIGGFRFQVRFIDLAPPWRRIHEDMLRLLG